VEDHGVSRGRRRSGEAGHVESPDEAGVHDAG
jgi:hypothetical protein